MNKSVLTLAIFVFAALPAFGQTALRRSINDLYLTCESTNNQRNVCAVDTRNGVRLARKISDSSCVQGTDWGYDANGIWVNNGCRAEFAVTYDVVGLGLEPPAFSRVVCESINNKRNHCPAAMGGVQLATQLSDNDCVLGRTWGYDRDGIWVSNGCRGVFTVLHAPGSVGMISSSPAVAPARVMCESQNNTRKHCPAETRFGVMLSRRLSDNSCEFRRDWGFDENGIWVNNGCRAEFVLDNDR